MAGIQLNGREKKNKEEYIPKDHKGEWEQITGLLNIRLLMMKFLYQGGNMENVSIADEKIEDNFESSGDDKFQGE